MNSRLVLVFLLPVALANPICPMCSLGAPSFGATPSFTNAVEAAPSYGSYPRSQSPSPLSMYQGDAALFGTELGRAIAQRIQQLYSQGPTGSSTKMNTGNSFSSYPEPVQSRPAPLPYPPMDQVQLAPSVTEARALEYPAPIPAPRGGCPYCFGGNNSNNGFNGFGGSGGYAASPPRGRRIEFVKGKKSRKI